MEDWQEKLAELTPRLDAWYEQFDGEFRKLAKKKGGLFSKPTAAELDEAEREARVNVGEALLSEAAMLLDRISLRYLEALPGERAQIRAHVGQNESVFRFYWTYLQSWPESIQDENTLRLAFAAASVHDLRSDIDLVNDLLARIWLAAEKLGLDPRPALADVTKVSNRTTGGGSTHFRAHLKGFEHSVYFREVVQPLRQTGRRAQAS
jgi:hypothetical protein